MINLMKRRVYDIAGVTDKNVSVYLNNTKIKVNNFMDYYNGDGVSAVLHPMVAYDLKANLTNTFANENGNDLANEALRNGFVGRLGGVPIYETTNVSNDGTAGDYKQGVFHRDALALAMMQDLKIETQRDASLRADEIVATAVYGVGELNDANGCEVESDSSIQ